MLEGAFGTAGEQVVIEEFLEGEEVSILTFSDGITFKSLPPAQDDKKTCEGDKGPNTGGMGCYAPVILDRTTLQDIEEKILKPTFERLKKEGEFSPAFDFQNVLKSWASKLACSANQKPPESVDGLLIGTPFVAMLFTGIMITKEGPKVLEYNARFGDPETQALLPLISEKTDFVDILIACVQGRLSEQDILMVDKSCAVVVCSAEGYPGECLLGDEVNIKDRQSTAGKSILNPPAYVI
jgi:phosphoribosylamine--glycine ligase / phosphoribosylformylglycinamidine cyclo-ligase